MGIVRNKIGFCIVFFLFFTFHSHSGLNYSCILYESYLKENVRIWPAVIDLMEKEFLQTNSYDLLFETTLAQNGYTAYLLIKKQKSDALQVINTALSNIELLKKKNFKPAETEALHATLLIYQAAIQKEKSLLLVLKAMKCFNKAKELSKSNYFVLLEKNNFDHMMLIKLKKGNIDVIISEYEKAIQLFEKSNSGKSCNWYYINSYVWLAKAFERAGKEKQAKETYVKLLQLAPGFSLAQRNLNRFK